MNLLPICRKEKIPPIFTNGWDNENVSYKLVV